MILPLELSSCGEVELENERLDLIDETTAYPLNHRSDQTFLAIGIEARLQPTRSYAFGSRLGANRLCSTGCLEA